MTDEDTLRARHRNVLTSRTDPGARPSMTWNWCACGSDPVKCEVRAALAIVDEARAERDAAWKVGDAAWKVADGMAGRLTHSHTITHGLDVCDHAVCLTRRALAAYDAARKART